MTHSFLRMLVLVNRVLSTINGFIFGILMQWSPIHSRKGKPARIPLAVNVALLATLIVLLILLFRNYGYVEPTAPVRFF